MKRTFAEHVWKVLARDNERPKTAREIALSLHVRPERVRPFLRRWLLGEQLYRTLPSEKERRCGSRNAYGISPGWDE